MSNKVEWSDKFITGVNEIDEQHKEVAKSVNDLYQSIEENKDKETIIKLIESLDSYTTLHFDTEEKYMKMYNYSGYEEHKKAHDFFKSTYEQIRYNYHYIGDKNSPKYQLIHIMALHLSQTLIDWLNLHLQTFDKEFAFYVKDKIKET